VASVLALMVVLMAVTPGSQADAPAQDCCGPCEFRACVGPVESELAKYLMDSSSELFFGTVISEELAPCCDRRADVTFRVLRRWKGSDAAQIRIRTPACTQIYAFALQGQYLVSAIASAGEPPVLNRCYAPLEGEGAAYPIMSELDKVTSGARHP
jgi:hypothetical protein